MTGLAERLNRAWLRRGPLACALWPLSLLMAALVRLRRHAYRAGWLRATRLAVPVIVVGNRIVGGAGKTPTTIALLQHLQSQGWRPGVLSRGYKRQAGGRHDRQATLLDAQTGAALGPRDTGDEPLLIWRRTGAPMMIHPDRAAGGAALLAAHPEVDILVCDDGLQHLRLQRDIEVIVFDTRGAGNGWLLPAGPLREPVDSPPTPGLRAPPIVLYNAPLPSTALSGHLATSLPRPLVRFEDWWVGRATDHPLPPPRTSEADCVAAAGIAHPDRFFQSLRDQGFSFRALPLPDHADLAVLPWPPDVREVILTEKDAVKLTPARLAQERPHSRVWVAALDLQPDDAFWRAFDRALAALHACPQSA